MSAALAGGRVRSSVEGKSLSDYERIARAIAFIVDRVHDQPDLAAIAAHVHMSPYHFQRLFCRWAGVTPKRFLQVLTVERAKQLLSRSQALLEVSESLGLSSGSRLYDHFVQLEAVTPGQYKQGGAGMQIAYGQQDTPFGRAFAACTARGVCQFAFVDYVDVDALCAELRGNFPQAKLVHDDRRIAGLVEHMFKSPPTRDRPLSLHVCGTNFQVRVWRALLRIPPANVLSYTQVAEQIGQPRAARAVGNAVAANPVAFLIPCHRVIQQSGRLGGYHWGSTRLHALHAWESARYDS